MSTGVSSGFGAGAGHAPTRVTVRYWAGARAAAGVESETVEVPGRMPAGSAPLSAVLDVVGGRHPALSSVLAVSTFLVDGLATDRSAQVASGATLEVLPPFAGG